MRPPQTLQVSLWPPSQWPDDIPAGLVSDETAQHRFMTLEQAVKLNVKQSLIRGFKEGGTIRAILAY